MKKEQYKANFICKLAYSNAMAQMNNIGFSECGRLRTCQAYVYETEDYYILESYRTIVAVINKGTDVCYDVLRMVYGYTATSAQHIAKFRHDYGKGKWGCKTVYTYR